MGIQFQRSYFKCCYIKKQKQTQTQTKLKKVKEKI